MMMVIPVASATRRSAAGSRPISSRVRSTKVRPPASRSSSSSWRARCSSLSRPVPRYSRTRSAKTCSCGTTAPRSDASTGPVTDITCMASLCRPDGLHSWPACQGTRSRRTGMYLSPTEEDRLRIFTAAELARRTRADGVKLNAPETTALICDEMHRAARSGASFEAVLAAGRAAVASHEVIDGVPALVQEIRIEVLLEDGVRLVVLRDPLAHDGNQPGEIRARPGEIELGPGLSRRRIRVTSISSRPIRVSSHYPFWRVNSRLEFDRGAAEGYRLDLPAGASISWAPGEVRDVDLIVFGGHAPVPAPPGEGS